MHLSSLKLNGFKSFADPTVLSFEPGVTAVVGPNGCGKSNIADAIRWALGEQSAKALRGGKMMDVIFEGSDSRKALPFCEVSLLFTNCEDALGEEYHEVEITRRGSREGGGDYFLNGKSCRLKDIQRLFMDTGVGRTSYSIMAQGQIDQILSSKPEDRRAVFEEAAGITRYKSQRRETLNKLAAVEANLSRVGDVIGEVSRQIGSLRRQASKALRYRRLSHRQKHLDLAVNAWSRANLSGEIQQLEQSISGLDREVGAANVDFVSKDRYLLDAKQERAHLNQRVQEAQQAVFDVRSQREQAVNQAHVADVRRTGLLERLEQARAEVEASRQKIDELNQKADVSVRDRTEHMTLLDKSDEAFRQREDEVRKLEAELARLGSALQKRKHEALALESTLVRLRNEVSTLQVDEKTGERRLHELEESVANGESELNGLQEARDAISSKVAELRSLEREAQSNLESARAAQARQTDEYRQLQSAIQQADRSCAQKSARLKVLLQLRESYEGFGAGAKLLLKGGLPGWENTPPLSALSRHLRVRSKWSRAIAALLGQVVEAVLAEDAETALRLVNYLRERKAGQAYLRFPRPGHHISSAPASLPEGVAAAETCLEGNAEEKAIIASLLEGCFVVESSEALARFATAEAGPFNFRAIASPEGDLLDARGILFGGDGKGSGAGQSIVERENEIEQTRVALEGEQSDLAGLREKATSLQEALLLAEAEVEEKREALGECRQHTAFELSQETAAVQKLADHSRQLDRLRREIDSMRQTVARASERLGAMSRQQVEAETQLSENRVIQTELEEGIATVRTELESRREDLAQARFHRAEQKQKLDVLSKGLSEMESMCRSLQSVRSTRLSEIEQWEEEVEKLLQEKETQDLLAAELEDTLATARQSVETIRSKLVSLEERIGILEKEQAFLRQQVESSKEKLGSLEVELARKRARLEFQTEEVRRKHQTEIDSVDWRFSLWKAAQEPEGLRALDLDEDDEDLPRRRRKPAREPGETPSPEELQALEETDWSASEAEATHLEQRLQAMGPVNLVAIEEYGDLRERHQFLQTQNDDLTSARERLLRAIDEINQTSQKQFADTFAQIRKNFASTFQTLFGGGKADLQLVENEDILESGIEIAAQPPGTKLKSVSLLSGGQRTMTAVALLFAIYLVKPSPFCVLDELDAPLDESNIGRFTDLLNQFARDSQFLIITHNKRTIAACHAIYGVTMEERGVSKVVSMKFHTTRGQEMAESVEEIPPVSVA